MANSNLPLSDGPLPDGGKNFRWNFSVNLLDLTLFVFALSMISTDTVMPILVRHLTGSTLAIGLIPAIFTTGYSLPQMISAHFSERLRYKKPLAMLMGGLFERGPYPLIAVTMAFVALSHPRMALILFFLFLAISTCGGGLACPPWYDLIAKAIPTHRRGLWAGLSQGLGALMGVAGAAVVAHVLETYAYPTHFAILFGLASVVFVASWVGLALNRESPSVLPSERVTFSQYVRQLPDIFRKDSNYVRYLLSRVLVQFGAMSAGFFTVYALDRFQIQGRQVGLFTGILVGSEALMNLIWGLAADRGGHKRVLAGGAFAMAGASLAAFMARSDQGMIIPFILLGVFRAAISVSSLNIILEFCTPEKRPTYIGMTNSLLAPSLFLAPMVAGGLIVWLGYRWMFLLALFCAILGGSALTLKVKEPRHETRS